MSSAMGGMDAAIIVSGISAVLQAAQTWIAYRDSSQAGDVFQNAIASGISDPSLAQAANQLSMVPERILSAFGMRLEICWTNYENILIAPRGSYMPQDIDEATEAVKRCVCRELRRLKSVNGTLPPGKLRQWWEEYGCS